MTKNAYRLSVSADPLFEGGVVRGRDPRAWNCHRPCTACCLSRKLGASAAGVRRPAHRHGWSAEGQYMQGGEAEILHSKFRL